MSLDLVLESSGEKTGALKESGKKSEEIEEKVESMLWVHYDIQIKKDL